MHGMFSATKVPQSLGADSKRILHRLLQHASATSWSHPYALSWLIRHAMQRGPEAHTYGIDHWLSLPWLGLSSRARACSTCRCCSEHVKCCTAILSTILQPEHLPICLNSQIKENDMAWLASWPVSERAGWLCGWALRYVFLWQTNPYESIWPLNQYLSH